MKNILIFFLIFFTLNLFGQNEIQVENSSQNVTIDIRGDGPDNHGQIKVKQSNNNEGVIIDGGESVGGGQINLYNSLQLPTLQIDAEGGSDVGKGPFLNMINVADNTGLTLSAQEGINNGSVLKMYNYDGVQTIELDAEGGEFSSGATGSSNFNMLTPSGVNTVNFNSQWAETAGGIMFLKTLNNTTTASISAQEGTTNGATLKLYNYAGTKTIELDADQGTSGKGRVITQELQITGGSDFAENFIVPDYHDSQKGMVLCLDIENEGQLKLSNKKYDQKVVGIVSGANGVDTGLMMSDSGTIADGKVPVALVGRVYVKTNKEGGEIKIGDLITTSSQQGIAMRIKNKRKAQGAIVGKAMTKADENGFVLVLVNLQ